MSIKTVFYLGLRPFIPKKHGIKGVVAHTIIVVAIAMLPLVVVLMVADGMVQGITSRYIETSSFHFRLYSRQSLEVLDIDEYNKTINDLKETSGITSVAVERTGAGVGVFNDSRQGLTIRGVSEDLLELDSGMANFLTMEKGEFVLDNDSILISAYLAHKMKLDIGDDFRLITGKVLSSGKILPRVTKLKVKGVFKTGYEELDKLWVFVSLDVSKKILPANSSETFIGLKCDDPYGNLDKYYNNIKEAIPSGWLIRNWTQLNRYTYESLKTTNMVLALIMGLIVIVAGINISSSLIMLVLEKRRDIAILKGMGLSPKEVRGSYLLTGIIIGLIGTIIGIIIGITISLNINLIISSFESFIGFFFDGFNFIFHIDAHKKFVLLDSAYYLDDIPVELDCRKLLYMTFFSITITSMASYMPARKAGLIKPLEIMQKY